jgi:AraC-like DNA-binding protein
MVEALLSNPALKVEGVALSAGFGEVAAFSRAFKRWTGSSPTQYRRRLARTRSTARSTAHRQAGARAAR